MFLGEGSGIVTPEELTRAKGLYTKSLETDLSSDPTVAGMLSSNLFYEKSLAWQRDLLKRVNAVTQDDLVRVAKKYVHPDSFVTVKVGTF